MFLQYSIAGALIPLYSLHLQELGFTSLQIGWACATQALAGMAGPLCAGQIADRWLRAERCLSFCALIAALLLWILAGLTTFLSVFLTSLAFWLMLAPAITLGTSLSFVHLSSPERHFGGVRLWGTVGWVLPGWLMGYWFNEPTWVKDMLNYLRPAWSHTELADFFRLASLLAIGLALYALTLPPTPPQHQAKAWLAPLAALKHLRSRAFIVYWTCVLGVCVSVPFTSQVTPLFLQELGIKRPWLSPIMTLGQSMEIVSLALLPLLLLRFGIRGTMLIGLGSWALDLCMLTVGKPLWLVIASLTLNGLCICCFLVAGLVFVNSRARDDIRASSQALVTFVNGLGMLIGNLLVGWVRELAGGEFMPTYATGAGIALALVVIFFFGFPTDESILSESDRLDLGKGVENQPAISELPG